MRLGVGVAGVGAVLVGDYGRVELLFEVAAQALDAAFGFFGELELAGAVFDGVDGLAQLEFEVLEQGAEFLFELAGALFGFEIAFAGEAGALLVERVLLGAGGFAFGFKIGKLLVQIFAGTGRCRPAACPCGRGRCARFAD